MGEIEEFGAIVIGAGQAGPGVAAARAAEGKRTALIELDRSGGTCLNHGCKPTKALRASAVIARHVQRAAEYGVHVEGVRVDFGEAIGRVHTTIDTLRQSLQDWLDGVENLEQFAGVARLETVGGRSSSGPPRGCDDERAGGLPRPRWPGRRAADPRSVRRRVPDRGRAAEPDRAARAPGDRRRRLHRLRVRPDLPPVRLRGDHLRRRPAGRPGGRGHLRPGRRHPHRGGDPDRLGSYVIGGVPPGRRRGQRRRRDRGR